MEYIVSEAEAKEIDRITINEYEVASLTLIERAARAAKLEMEKRVKASERKPSLLVLCGRGNNGADGLCFAKLCANDGYPVMVFLTEPQKRRTAENEILLQEIKGLSVPILSELPTEEFDVIVDAVLGIGFTPRPQNLLKEVMEKIHAMKGFKIALDIPSFLSTDTGEAGESAMVADLTVTFGFRKRGLLINQGPEHAGEVVVADIGFSDEAVSRVCPEWIAADSHPATMPVKRPANGNKGTFGKLLVIAGSETIGGAAILCAGAAYRSGCGMVKVLGPVINRNPLLTVVPECLYGGYEELAESIKWASAVVIGPGIGQGSEALRILGEVLRVCEKPLVLDADAINLIASHEALRILFQNRKAKETILTPHVMELYRICTGYELTKEPFADFALHFWEYAKQLASLTGAVVAAKDFRTFLLGDKQPIAVNTLGNSGMAVAGSGDVLAGILGAAFCIKKTAYDTAVYGVVKHAWTGDRIRELTSEEWMNPRDYLTYFSLEATKQQDLKES